jgi:hypothetical protein
MISAMKLAVCATWPGSLTTAVQPAASAGIVSTAGEFQGAITAATPMGWRRTMEMLPGLGVSARPLSSRAAAAA